MAGPISSRPISDAGISDDGQEYEVQQGVFKRRIRVRVQANRYEGVAANAPANAAPAAPSTPTYNSLAPAERAGVDRVVVGFRLATMRGTP